MPFVFRARCPCDSYSAKPKTAVPSPQLNKRMLDKLKDMILQHSTEKMCTGKGLPLEEDAIWCQDCDNNEEVRWTYAEDWRWTYTAAQPHGFPAAKASEGSPPAGSSPPPCPPPGQPPACTRHYGRPAPSNDEDNVLPVNRRENRGKAERGPGSSNDHGPGCIPVCLDSESSSEETEIKEVLDGRDKSSHDQSRKGYTQYMYVLRKYSPDIVENPHRRKLATDCLGAGSPTGAMRKHIVCNRISKTQRNTNAAPLVKPSYQRQPGRYLQRRLKWAKKRQLTSSKKDCGKNGRSLDLATSESLTFGTTCRADGRD